MFCAQCGTQAPDGVRFCSNCGTALQAPGAVMQRGQGQLQAPLRNARRPNANRPQNPYQQQIRELRLQIRQLKIYLREINTQMSNTRFQFNEVSAFSLGIFGPESRFIEQFNLMGPQQQRQALQQQIIQLEQQLLGLQQQQEQWRREQGLV